MDEAKEGKTLELFKISLVKWNKDNQGTYIKSVYVDRHHIDDIYDPLKLEYDESFEIKKVRMVEYNG